MVGGELKNVADDFTVFVLPQCLEYMVKHMPKTFVLSVFFINSRVMNCS